MVLGRRPQDAAGACCGRLCTNPVEDQEGSGIVDGSRMEGVLGSRILVVGY